MKRSSLLLLFFLTQAAVLADTVFYFPQVADGTVADIRLRTTVILLNTSAGNADIILEFFTSAGQPLTVTLGNRGTASQFEVTLARGESFSQQTPGTGPLQAGYARVTVGGDARIGGTAVFTQSDPVTGIVLYEAGVPASSALSNFTVIVDSTGSRDTGLAMLNPPAAGGAPANVVATLYDQSFSEIATTNIPLAVGEHRARFVWELFDGGPQNVVDTARNMKGSLTVRGAALAAVTLRQNATPGVSFPDEVPTLTTFPVIPGAAEQTQAASSLVRLEEGELELNLDLSAEQNPVTGLAYRAFRNDVLIGSSTLGLSPGRARHEIRLAGVPGGLADRVDFQLIYRGGTAGSAFRLAVDDSRTGWRSRR